MEFLEAVVARGLYGISRGGGDARFVGYMVAVVAWGVGGEKFLKRGEPRW